MKKVSIIILTYNCLEEATKPCLESIYAVKNRTPFEVIVVDNMSTDGTRDYLREFTVTHGNFRVILREQNYGYAAGNNTGIRAMNADFYILLNNDTIVTDFWIDKFVAFFEAHPDVGMAGPVSNSVGNEQVIYVNSKDQPGIIKEGLEWAEMCSRDYFHTEMLGFFCVCIKKEVINKVGFLDEQFGIGMFEDDDYCLRVRQNSYKLAILENIFIYHRGSISFNKLKNDFSQLFLINKSKYENKHNVNWTTSFTPKKFYQLINKYLQQLPCTSAVYRKIENKLKVISALDNFEDLLIQLKIQLSEKDQQLASTNQVLSEKVHQLALRDQQLADKLQELTLTNQQLALRDEQLASANQMLSEKVHQLALRDQQLADKLQELTLTNQQLALRDEQLACANQQLVEFHDSLSWKITAPARKVLALLQSIPMLRVALTFITKSFTRLVWLKSELTKKLHQNGIASAVSHGYIIISSFLRRQIYLLTHRDDYDRQLRQLSQIISQAQHFIDIFHVPMGWSTPLFQRFQHISLQVPQLGGLAIYGGHLQVDKDILVFKQVKRNLLVINALDENVVAQVFKALKQSPAPKMLRIQSIDCATRIETVKQFLEEGLKVVYEYIDEITDEITGNVPEFVGERHLAMLADERILVVATSDKLYEEVLRYRKHNCLLSTNGVDLSHWRLNSKKIPTDMKAAVKSGRLVIGYHGALAKWLDYNLLRRIADHGNYVIVLIGYEHDTEFENSGLKEHPYVHYLGSKSYFDLNRYAACYDIAILPFSPNILTQSVSPVKIFEYMAAGKPVVTTDLRECRKYKSCLVAQNHEEFMNNLATAAALRNSKEYLELLAEEAEQNSWETKTREVLRLAGI